LNEETGPLFIRGSELPINPLKREAYQKAWEICRENRYDQNGNTGLPITIEQVLNTAKLIEGYLTQE